MFISNLILNVHQQKNKEMNDEDNLTQTETIRIEKTQIPSPFVDSQFLNTSALIHRNVENLESRVSTCNSIYKLATDTNDMRQREQNQQIKNIEEYLKAIENRIESMEKYFDELPDKIRAEANKGIEKRNIYGDLEAQIAAFDQEFEKRFDALENIIQENNKENAKKYKRIKADIELLQNGESSQIEVERFRSQLQEIDQKNKQLKSMADTLKAQND